MELSSAKLALYPHCRECAEKAQTELLIKILQHGL